MNFNSVILCGNITKDPELRYTPSGTAVCSFTLAVNNQYTDKNGDKKNDASFIRCNTFKRTAEIINQYCVKGSNILVQGRLQQRSWEKDGEKKTVLEVNVLNIQLGNKPKGNGNVQENTEAEQPEGEEVDLND